MVSLLDHPKVAVEESAERLSRSGEQERERALRSYRLFQEDASAVSHWCGSTSTLSITSPRKPMRTAHDRGVITLVPYRSFEVDCPVCRVALRAERARLYCDACGGMLIEVDDLVMTIEQLVQIEPEVQFVTGAVGTRPCPRCASPMVMCHLRVAWSDDLRPESYWQSDSNWHYERLARGRTLRSELDRCAAHGVWFDRDELPEIIDRLRVATRSAGVSTRA